MKNPLILFISYAIVKIILYLDLQIRFFPELTFLNVGQGDAILITTPERKRILVDGGAGFTVSHLLNGYFPLNNCSLDAIFLTHPHADHLEGLLRILRYCRVEKVFYTPVQYEGDMFAEWEARLGGESQILPSEPVVTPFLMGGIYVPDKLGNIRLYGVWPPSSYIDAKIPNVNNVSIVMFLDVGNFEALLTGDAEQEVLKELEGQEFPFVDGNLDVYKLSHHGSRTGLRAGFLEQLNPLLSVISVGKDNKFGHPHEEVLTWLEEKQALYKRTDMEGTIKIRYNSL
jgi:competence protein ComEC